MTVTMPGSISHMDYVNLEGTVEKAGLVCGNQAFVECPPHKIVTVRFTLENE